MRVFLLLSCFVGLILARSTVTNPQLSDEDSEAQVTSAEEDESSSQQPDEIIDIDTTISLTGEERKIVGLLERIQLKYPELMPEDRDEFLDKLMGYRDRFNATLSKVESIPGQYGLNVELLKTALKLEEEPELMEEEVNIEDLTRAAADPSVSPTPGIYDVLNPGLVDQVSRLPTVQDPTIEEDDFNAPGIADSDVAMDVVTSQINPAFNLLIRRVSNALLVNRLMTMMTPPIMPTLPAFTSPPVVHSAYWSTQYNIPNNDVEELVPPSARSYGYHAYDQGHMGSYATDVPDPVLAPLNDPVSSPPFAPFDDLDSLTAQGSVADLADIDFDRLKNLQQLNLDLQLNLQAHAAAQHSAMDMLKHTMDNIPFENFHTVDIDVELPNQFPHTSPVPTATHSNSIPIPVSTLPPAAGSIPPTFPYSQGSSRSKRHAPYYGHGPAPYYGHGGRPVSGGSDLLPLALLSGMLNKDQGTGLSDNMLPLLLLSGGLGGGGGMGAGVPGLGVPAQHYSHGHNIPGYHFNRPINPFGAGGTGLKMNPHYFWSQMAYKNYQHHLAKGQNPNLAR